MFYDIFYLSSLLPFRSVLCGVKDYFLLFLISFLLALKKNGKFLMNFFNILEYFWQKHFFSNFRLWWLNLFEFLNWKKRFYSDIFLNLFSKEFLLVFFSRNWGFWKASENVWNFQKRLKNPPPIKQKAKKIFFWKEIENFPLRFFSLAKELFNVIIFKLYLSQKISLSKN